MLKGHKGPRRSARPMISLLGFRMVRSDGRIHSVGRFRIGAGAPILYGRFRPIPGELPKGTVIETLLCQLKICHFHMRFKLMEHKGQ